MFRTLTIIGITAIAMAAAPVLAPQADARSDLDRFLIGATAIAIVGAIAADHNKKKRRAVNQQYVEPPRYNRHRNHNRHQTRHQNRHRHQDRYQSRHHRDHRQHQNRHAQNPVQIYPKQCLRQRWGNHGWVTYYSNKCLSRHVSAIQTNR